MVLCGIASFLEVGHYCMRIDKGQLQASCFFHDADAPVDVSRMTVFQVVGKTLGYVQAGIESLMADQHALLERPPCQDFWRPMGTKMEEMALGICDGRVAIDDCRQGVLGCSFRS